MREGCLPEQSPSREVGGSGAVWEAGDLARAGRTVWQENRQGRGPREARLGGTSCPGGLQAPSPRRPPQVPRSRKALDSIADPTGLGPSQASPLSVCLPGHLLHTPAPLGLRGQKFQRKGSG